jgi:hypothetical protein
MNFEKSRMYYSVDGVDGAQLIPCQVMLRDDSLIIEYVDEGGSRVTYQANKNDDGAFEVRQELAADDYLYTALLYLEETDFYGGTWHQRYGNQHKRGSWSIELA